ncbi:MAG: DUF4384 domain-containing protein [Candidatus Cloacimonetes bacterium]|nr:DUF4384 domain-containing protein [Candidatus Cloacimonadota bacterium]NLO43959.1 DUF4384 domain-containing protein [Candidatus Cloacimonadota bacterium]
MRKIVVSLVLILALFACSQNKLQEQSQSAPQDVSREEVHVRKDQAFSKLDGEGTATTAVRPQTTMHKVTPSQVPSNVKVSQAGGRVIVEIDTLLVFSGNVSLFAAENEMRKFVRELALKEAIPSDVSISTLVSDMYIGTKDKYDEKMASSVFLMSSSAGRFEKEEFINKDPRYEGTSLHYRLQYRAHIVPQERVYNPSMNLRVELSENLLKHKDQFVLSLTPNVDGYLYIFEFLNDSSVAMVFPNVYLSENYLAAGENWRQTLEAHCPPDEDAVIETLYFIFSRDPIAGWEEFEANLNAQEMVYSAGEQSFSLFHRWLGKCDPMRRVEKMAQIHIFQK